MRYVALLRGINVGGQTSVSMDDLKRVFAKQGLTEITTYIQSGNVIFTAAESPDLATGIEQRIATSLGREIRVLLRSSPELQRLLTCNPYLIHQPDLTKLHVTFLAEAPDDDHVTHLEVPAGETAGYRLAGREVYLHCPDGYGRTKLNNTFLERRLGVAATTRNWKTVVKLVDLTS